jgi:hypothetical protein
MGEDRKQSDTAVLDPPQSAVRPLRVGITGHTDLRRATVRLVADALDEHLRLLRREPSEGRRLIGVSCLAPGADCVFAEVVLRLGGELEVILPSTDYVDSQVSGQHAPVFDDLLRQAGSVRIAGYDKAGPQAYAAANDLMLESVDHLLAVWNGVVSDELGGTAHAVSAARARELPVTVIWPEGARRG